MYLKMVKLPGDNWSGLSGNLILLCNVFIQLVNGLGEMPDNMTFHRGKSSTSSGIQNVFSMLLSI